MRVGECTEISAVESGTAQPANKLHAFVHVEVMAAIVLADQKLRQMPHGSGAELGPCRRDCGHVEQGQCWPRLFLGKQFEFESGPESPTPEVPESRSIGLFKNHDSRFLTAPHFSSPLLF